ncbi:hypothetical protein D3C75_1283460 [compost metagenome]
MHKQARFPFPLHDGAVDLDLLQRQFKLLHHLPGVSTLMTEQFQTNRVVIFVYSAERNRFNLDAGKT